VKKVPIFFVLSYESERYVKYSDKNKDKETNIYYNEREMNDSHSLSFSLRVEIKCLGLKMNDNHSFLKD
jgi:hypothetical protein